MAPACAGIGAYLGDLSHSKAAWARTHRVTGWGYAPFYRRKLRHPSLAITDKARKPIKLLQDLISDAAGRTKINVMVTMIATEHNIALSMRLYVRHDHFRFQKYSESVAPRQRDKRPYAQRELGLYRTLTQSAVATGVILQFSAKKAGWVRLIGSSVLSGLFPDCAARLSRMI